MDRIRKRSKPAKKKKVLLSIVDPWDVSIASVDGLAGRRGLSIEPLDWSSPRSLEQAAPSSSPSSPRTPWPWYKPPSYCAAWTTKANGPSSGGSSGGLSGAGGGSGGAVADVPIKRQRAEAADKKDSERASRRLSDRSFIRSLVEELVRSRYKSTPALQRGRRRRRPRAQRGGRSSSSSSSSVILPAGSISHSGRSVSSLATEANFWTRNNHWRRIEESKEEERRRLSLSMPTKLDDAMEDHRIANEKGESLKFPRRESDSSATFSNSGSTLNGSTLASETEDEENEEEASKVPLQSHRVEGAIGASPANSRKMNNDLDYPNVQSTNSTITSVNSISSLLKEKLQWTIPQALRSNKKRQSADYRLRAFVGVLFLCVVFLVGFAHIYYSRHVLQRAYFDKFRFNKNERLLRVYNGMGVEIIAARLGVGIPSDTGVFSCLAQHQRPGAVCLEWLAHSRLYLGHTRRDAVHCYQVTWQSLDAAVSPRDCFDWSAKRGHWYGAGQTRGMAYPLEQAGRLEASPFVTGDARRHPFGSALRRYFINSKGASISVDPRTPLYVSLNASQAGARGKELCLMAKHDGFAFSNHLTPLPQLNYSICAADNMRSLHALTAERFAWEGLRPDELQAVHSLLTEPVWQVSPTNEADVYNYTEDVIALGFLRQGHVLLSEQWQPSSGDLALDERRFRSMNNTIDVIHRRGFRIAFALQPFVSTESASFREAVRSRLLISERGSDPRIPALTRYGPADSAGVLDITANRTLPWIAARLAALQQRYRVDAFYLDLGTAHDMPHYYKCERPLDNPDHYKSLFVEAILGLAVPVIGVSGAVARPRAPVFVSLPPFASSWKAIKTVIPAVLSYGIIGYPLVMPGAVGGDVALPMSDDNPDNDFEVRLPDKELYVRWLQLSTFLPVMRFTHLPSKYSDESVLEIAKSLTALRQKHVTPRLKKFANVTLDTGLPIIRPLWMLDPADPACHLLVDEFSVGDEIIVAPILHSGSRQREVYLPAGVWKDGIDQSLRKGSRWLHQYRVAEDKIAYFIKMPADMRF